MCLALLGTQIHQHCAFTLIFNRDEYYGRASLPLRVWSTPKDMVAGVDLKSEGTWAASHSSGCFAALLHHRDPARRRKNARPRGEIVRLYFEELNHLGEIPDARRFVEKLTPGLHNDFNLIFGHHSAPHVYSSVNQTLEPLSPGWHAFSNGLPNDLWPKSRLLKNFAEETFQETELQAAKGHERLELHMRRKQTFPQETLPQTGVPEHFEKALSAAFIETPQYGTISQIRFSMHQTATMPNPSLICHEISFDPHLPLVETRLQLKMTQFSHS